MFLKLALQHTSPCLKTTSSHMPCTHSNTILAHFITITTKTSQFGSLILKTIDSSERRSPSGARTVTFGAPILQRTLRLPRPLAHLTATARLGLPSSGSCSAATVRPPAPITPSLINTTKLPAAHSIFLGDIRPKGQAYRSK